MTKKDRAQIVAYIDAKVTYAIETLEADIKTDGKNRSVFKGQLEEAREMLLTGVIRKRLLKQQPRSKKAGPTTYREGDQQWQNPAQRGE